MSAGRLHSRLLVGLSLASLLPLPAAAVTIFSEGMVTPQTITQAPAGYAGVAGASFLIPDSAAPSAKNNNARTVWLVPETGGPPVAFSSGFADTTLSGMFLPASWGTNAGKFATAGRGTVNVSGVDIVTGFVYTYDESGARTQYNQYLHAPFNQAILSPAGDKLVLAESENFGRIDTLAADGTFTEGFSDTTLIVQAFGLAFAPPAFGGQLLVSDAFSGAIVAVDTGGVATAFTTIDLLAGQTGLREMAFAPTDFLIDFGIPGDVLLVSVAGSLLGGGTLGDVLAVDSSGTVVASLKVIDDLDRFDPRGMFFGSGGSLLVSDTSDPIILAGASDFVRGRFANVTVGEPSIEWLFAIALAGFGGVRLLRSRLVR